MTSAKLVGYHADADLPIKPGDYVVVPKGTIIKAMGPVKEKIAGCSYKVQVHHLLNGQSFGIGFVTGEGERRAPGLYRKDEDAVKRVYGAYSKDLLNHPDAVIRDRTVYLPICNPTVRWAGAGGYWHEADINDVRLVSAANTPKETT